MAVIGLKTGDPADKRGAASSRVAASRARRCLFGPVTEAELANTESELHDRDRLVDDEKRRRWNFDFQRMVPLPGRWQWERVGQQTPAGCSAIERAPFDDSPNAAAVPSTLGTTPGPASDDTAAVETTSSTETQTCTAKPRPRRKRCRQSTLPGTVYRRPIYDNVVA